VEQEKDTPDVDIRIKSFLTASTITIPTPAAIGEAAPDFTLQDIDGKQVSLSDLIGKPIVLNFWDSASDHCRRQVLHLDALYRQYQDDGLVVIGINKEMVHGPVVEFARSKISYIVLLDGEGAFRAYGVSAIPCTYYIDRAGKVQRRYIGHRDRSVLEAGIKALLSGEE
jgi:peroxiredoxin